MSRGRVVSRKDWVDYMKAFAILLVLWGHFLSDMPKSSGIRLPAWQITETLVYAVHVPLFFIMAGYLCRPQPVGPFYRKKLLRVLIPFLFFSGLKIAYAMVTGTETSHGAGLAERLEDAFLYGNLYWFCYAILILYLAAPVMWRRDGKPGVTPVSAALAALCGLAYTLSYFHLLSLPRLFQFRHAVYYFPFFLTGYAAGQYREQLSAWWKARRWPLSLLSLAVLAVYILLVRKKVVSEAFFPAKYPAALALSHFLLMLALALPKGRKLLTFAGINSLQLMLLDGLYRKIVLDVLFASVALRAWMTVPMALLNAALGCATCFIVRKIPFVRILFGYEP